MPLRNFEKDKMSNYVTQSYSPKAMSYKMHIIQMAKFKITLQHVQLEREFLIQIQCEIILTWDISISIRDLFTHTGRDRNISSEYYFTLDLYQKLSSNYNSTILMNLFTKLSEHVRIFHYVYTTNTYREHQVRHILVKLFQILVVHSCHMACSLLDSWRVYIHL